MVAETPAPIAIRYRAFLSYAHADTAWAKWLHAALEGFRIDKDLALRATALGPVPTTLRPIFRDREDFSGGHALTDATIAALDASSALIVLCSTVAATRPQGDLDGRWHTSATASLSENGWPKPTRPTRSGNGTSLACIGGWQ